ncbi:transposable element Tcb1 transposase [Trichonephila clavipes]|nr:transposable element Tcb1 transposase [Trichonephila clavipes]
MIWGAFEYTSQSPLVRIKGTINSACYISGNVQTFLDTENIQLLLWPAHSPHLSPIENIWSMVAERLAHLHTPVTTVDELWHRVEAAWVSIPAHATQSLIQCPGE